MGLPSIWEVSDISIDQEDFYLQPDFVYRTLKILGHYEDENIIYLSAARYRDADYDNNVDVNSIILDGDMEYLLSDWLNDKTDNKDISTIYTFNHGSYNTLGGYSFLIFDPDRDGNCYTGDILNNKIKDFQVNNWLPTFGSGTMEHGRLNFITEACYVGHFIDALADDHRIITASTTYDTNATPMTGTDYPSFSFNLFKAMANGESSLGEAFNIVCPFVESEDYLPNNQGQNPKLDDWGDSDNQGSNHPLPDGNDGVWALKTGL